MRWLLAPIMALSWLIALAATARAGSPEIWFNPHSRADWLNLWKDDAPWQNAAKKVDVLVIVSWWLQVGTDDQIRAVFDFAKRHRMKVAMEASVIWRDRAAPCGASEGYTAPDEFAAQLAVLERLKLRIDILSMDEPVWFGHYSPDPTTCRLPIPELVDRIVLNVGDLLARHPDIQVVELEPIPPLTNFPDWRETLDTFHTLLARKTGRHVRSVQLDTDWDNPAWRQAMEDMRRYLRQRNMGLGYYVYGSGYSKSDAEWIDDAVRHMETAEGDAGLVPDQAVFASWSEHPQNTMPETSPTTLTWLINRYARERALLRAQFVGVGARGRLTTAQGTPIAGVPINGYVPGVDFLRPLPETVTEGVVPDQAAFGLVGYRLNVECLCAGDNDVLVGTLQYRESGKGSRRFDYILPFSRQVYNGVIVDAERVGGVQVNRVITTAQQTFAPNSAFFPVTPGAGFSYTVPASSVGGEGWHGHAFMLWFDKNYNGVPGTLTIIPKVERKLVSTAVTAADGSFELRKLPRSAPGPVPVIVEFAGNDRHRAAMWSPFR